MGLDEGSDPPHGRWRYIDEQKQEERAYRERALAGMDGFWRELGRRANDLRAHFSGKQDWDLSEWMIRQLKAVHPELMWEFGAAVRGDGHRLVITPESAKHLRPLVGTLLERAPQLPGWEFYPYRVPEDAEMAEQTVRARTGGTLADCRVQVFPDEGGLLDIKLLSPTATKDSDQAQHDAFVALETLLGEDLLDRWVGGITAEPLPAKKRAFLKWFGGSKEEAGPPLLDLSELHTVVTREIAAYRDQLSPQPHHVWTSEASWSLLELKPEREDDYAHQRDLFVAKTPHLALWQAAHSDRSFYDERFSRVGECFAYVKLDGSRGVDEERFAAKSELEDAIDAVLLPAGLGCQIGGGTGLRYSYIDLALAEPERGLQAVLERLRAGNVPRRSWVQFFASDLQREWIGVYPDSPPPPLAE